MKIFISFVYPRMSNSPRQLVVSTIYNIHREKPQKAINTKQALNTRHHQLKFTEQSHVSMQITHSLCCEFRLPSDGRHNTPHTRTHPSLSKRLEHQQHGTCSAPFTNSSTQQKCPSVGGSRTDRHRPFTQPVHPASASARPNAHQCGLQHVHLKR